MELISQEFIDKYKNKTVPFGFNGLGYIVFKRTYSRLMDNGSYEEWPDTIRRCINGAQEIGAGYTQEEAERLFDYMFNLKCSFAGRMLWQLGTNHIKRFGGNSLINCFFKAITKLEDFCFLFENLMLGGGVGYSVKREDIHELPKIKDGVKITHQNTKDADFIVPDSREGWVFLLRKVLKSYFYNGKSFTYSTMLVRGYGEPIKGFGGTASGPGILVEGIENICKIFNSRIGKKLRSIDVLDICNIIGGIVVSGNLRRTAQIALGDPDDYLYIRAKRWDLGNIPNYRSLSNNTIFADDYSHIQNDIWEGYKGNGEPYGFINIKLAQKVGRLSEIKKDTCEGVNPCLSGDTLVYVADGRGAVKISELAKENKDIPVFCLDNNKKITIRYMRNPRLTGKNKNLIKITLDDGSKIKVTPNHKFMLKNGKYIEAKNLKYNDSLYIITKYECSLKDMFKEANSEGQDYYVINNGQRKNIFEHRIIAEFHYNTKLRNGLVVHHKDYNGQNNNPNNLEILKREIHNKLHSFDKLGVKNPMVRAKKEWSEEKWEEYKKKHSINNYAEKNKNYSGYTNDDLKQHALILTRIIKRRFSTLEWLNYAKEHKLPMGFSKWREDNLGGILQLAKWAAKEEGYEKIMNEDPRIIKTYYKMLDEGYDAEIINGQVYINKKCEISGKPFRVPHERREVSVLAEYAHLKGYNNIIHKEKRIDNLKKAFKQRKIKNRKEQIEVFNTLKSELGRIPLKKEWQHKCKENKIIYRIGKCSAFSSFKEIKEESLLYNHRVIKIEECNNEDVYNGTVDEFHNFFIGGFEGKTTNNKKKWTFLNNLQCGELLLEDAEICCLSDIFLNNISSQEELIDCTELLYKTQKAVTGLNFIHEETTKIVHKNRRIGIGITGICQSTDKLDWLDNCYKEIVKFDKEWSKKKEIPESIRLTCIKPSGTCALLAGATPGIHPAFSKYYIRRIRMSSNDKLIQFCKNAGYNIESVLNFDGSIDYKTDIVEFPCYAGENAILAKDMTAIKQLELVKKLMTIWADNSISVTVYYKLEELEDIKKWLKDNYKNSIKSVSFLLHKDHGFAQAPYEEITKEQYEELISKIKPIKDLKIEDNNGIDVEECKGACPIK